ncbi:MAG TPA: hypothetical protein VGO47_11345 [Chlamydiales bacterium]|nr:hypothetical protein [Chlamydiales bacterium]
MDPFSITAGVVGFISFLHGFGKFLGKVAMAKKDEEEAIIQLTVHIRHLERILSEVQGYRQDLESASPGNQSVDSSELDACLDECRVKLQKFVDKLKDPNIKRKALLNRLKWPLRQEKSKKIVDLINQYKSSLQLELAVKQGYDAIGFWILAIVLMPLFRRVAHGTARDIHETAQDIHGRVQDIHGTAKDIQIKAAATQETTSIIQRGEILKRLDLVNVNVDFDKARSKCHPSTGYWFLESPEFEKYKETSGEHHWLHGMRTSHPIPLPRINTRNANF